jgi:hypothetical protein
MTYHSGPLEPDPNFAEFHRYMATKSRWALDDMGYDMDKYNLSIQKVGYKSFHLMVQVIIGFILISNNTYSGFYFLKE